MNRYKLHEPKADFCSPGEEVWFKTADFWNKGVVTSYHTTKKVYTISDGQPPTFYYNVKEVVRVAKP